MRGIFLLRVKGYSWEDVGELLGMKANYAALPTTKELKEPVANSQVQARQIQAGRGRSEVAVCHRRHQ